MSDQREAPSTTADRASEPTTASRQTGSDESNGSSLVVHPTAGGQSARWLPHLRLPLLSTGVVFLLGTLGLSWLAEGPVDPTNYAERTRRVLSTTPLIDGHNDLPWQLRLELHNRIYDSGVDFTGKLLGHTDLRRMREGMVGGQFWSVYVHCDAQQKHFEDPSWVVRDTLEQIDVTRRFIAEHPGHLEYCDTAACARRAFRSGRIASMIGIEGSHQVGGSIAGLRQMYNLGARYMTLTHNCDTAFATSTSTVAFGGADDGLLPLGYEAVKEMNRLGMMVDLSHVSHQTMRDVLSVVRAPVIFSHSGAYAVEPHLRHVPDDVLRSVKHNGGIVMAVFVNRFLNMKNPADATIHDVVDHILHIAQVAGWEHVGIGSDFSGTPHVPKGLEDVSKYPDLIELLMRRGVTDEQIRLLVGENLLRVWSKIENRAREIQATGERPVEAEYDGRKWFQGDKSTPWMLPGSRSKASDPAGGIYHMFNVDQEGKHITDVKEV